MFQRRPMPAMLVAMLALFACTAGVSYAATEDRRRSRPAASRSSPAPPSTTPPPISGADASAIPNHGMTISGTTGVVVPVSRHYLVTLIGTAWRSREPRFQSDGRLRRPARSTSPSAAPPALRRWRVRTPRTWPRERDSD